MSVSPDLSSLCKEKNLERMFQYPDHDVMHQFNTEPEAFSFESPSWRRIAKKLSNMLTQDLHHFVLKPDIAPEPTCVARAWVGQQDHLGPARTPVPHRIPKRQLNGFRQVPCLRIASDHHGEAHISKSVEQWLPPAERAFGARRQVALSSGSGIAKPHRQDGNLRRIPKGGRVEAEPMSQPHP